MDSSPASRIFRRTKRELRALKALTTALGVDNRVTFLGYVEPAEPLYHAWDVCVSTSAYETFGMTMLEAMACQCPVVAYPGGSVAEVIGADGGVLVADGDLGALVDAVRALAADRSHRSAMAAAGRHRAQRFDIRRSVDQLVAEYRAVLAP